MGSSSDFPAPCSLLRSPDSRFPIPDSRFPITFNFHTFLTAIHLGLEKR
ncbi:MAG: hypothetical protein F6K56_32050 [Moorea sp. SIO3G5]|nr:hypothetical protein [Moorena sp. SIO3G5]